MRTLSKMEVNFVSGGNDSFAEHDRELELEIVYSVGMYTMALAVVVLVYSLYKDGIFGALGSAVPVMLMYEQIYGHK